MVPEKKIKVLKLIINKLKNIDWALTGSTNLALQGMDIETNDIDILTDKKGVFAIKERLNKFLKKPIKYKETENYKTYNALFKIEDTEIEVLGEEENKFLSTTWTKKSRLSTKKFIKINNLEVPILPLEQEYIICTKLSRLNKAEKIKKFIENGPDGI